MRKPHSGFTLLELMLVVTIAGLLLAVGVPAMGNFLRNGRITAAANDVMAGLHFTRSEAIKRRQPVTLCTSADPLNANPVCTDSEFLTGWIVFVDDQTVDDNVATVGVDESVDAANGQREVGEVVLLQREAMPATITARSSADPFLVTYEQTGFAQNAAAAQLVLCDERGNTPTGGELSSARGIRIAVTGRAGVTRDLTDIQTLINEIAATVGGCT